MAVGIAATSNTTVDVASRTVVISNFPTAWQPTGSLSAKVGSLLEKFGKLTEPPFIACVPCKLGSKDNNVIAYATFDEEDAARRTVRLLHGADNRSGDEERLANYAPPNESEKYYVQVADFVPQRSHAEPPSEERASKAARVESSPHFLRVGMPRLVTEMPPLDSLSHILQKQLLIIAQCELPSACPAELRPKLLTPRLPGDEDELRLTLVLDLDGTLVECRSLEMPSADIDGMMTPLMVQLDGKAHTVYFRPQAQVLLATVAKLFEVVVFTASIQAYADQVLDHLDPERKWISARLYRQHCSPVPCGLGQVVFLKDMSLLGRPVDRVVLVDDSPISHMMTPDNGIVVSPWSADQTSDTELLALLVCLRECQRHALEFGSVTDYLVKRYGLRAFFKSLRSQAAAALRAHLESIDSDPHSSGSDGPSAGADDSLNPASS